MPSNARNLANLLGAGESTIGVEKLGNDVPPGTEDYSSVDSLGVGTTIGETAFVEGSNRLYIWNGSGWYNIALINTTPTWDSGGQPAVSYALDADSPQSSTTVTLAASDPEGIPISYSYVTGGSMDSIATVSQDSSVFTITPKTVAEVGEGVELTGSITFRATDGVNILPQVSSFTLNFISIVTNSKYTTLLATADGTSDNNNITDASTNNHSITVNGDAYVGTFSPYRSGGYSTYFGNGGSERITVEGTKSTLAGANANFSIGAWIYPTAGNDKWIYSTNISNNNQAGWHDLYLEGSTKLVWRHSDGSTHRSMMSTNPVSLNEWSYVLINRTSSVTYMYINGSLVAQNSDMTNALYTHTNAPSIGIRRFYDNSTTGLDFEGYITDVHVKTAAISSPTTVPTERAVADSDTWLLTAHLPYFADGSSNNYTVGAYNNVTTESVSPYDYNEYSATDHGGSVYFGGGTREHLSTSLPAFGTQDFEVEFWIYGGALTSSTWYTLFSRDYNVNGSFRIYASGGASEEDQFIYIANGTQYNYTSAGKIKDNVWNHILLSRVSGTAKWFINGIEDTSWSDSENMTSTATLYIGDTGADETSSSSYPFVGYMSDIAIRMGGSGYRTSTFTPPTTPLSSTSAELHIKGTDASIIDKSQGANLKLVGNTTGSTTQVKFADTKSTYFDGTGDGIVVPHNDNLNLNSCDWTIEYWFNVTNPGAIANWTFLQKGDNTTVRPYAISFRLDNNNGVEPRIFPSADNSTQGQISNNAWQTFNAWHHVAFVRVNSTGVITRYINGIANGTVTSDIATNTEDLYIGNVPSAADEEGYIQDLRITKGLARYTANFTPPTASLEG